MTTIATNIVSTSVPCRECGYDLVGLSTADLCPECAKPVGWSVRGDLLRFSSPEYLRVLHRGALTVVLAVVLQFFSYIAMIVLGVSAPAAVQSMGILSIVCMVALALGWWWLSTSDPGRLAEDRQGAARLVLRIALVGTVAAFVLAFGVLALLSVTSPNAASAISGIVGMATTLGYVVFFFASVLYLRGLARRAPAPKIERRATWLLWAAPISFGVFMLGMLLMVGAGAAGAVLMLAAGVMMFACWLSYLLLIDRVRAELKKALRAAEAHRASAAPDGFAPFAGPAR